MNRPLVPTSVAAISVERFGFRTDTRAEFVGEPLIVTGESFMLTRSPVLPATVTVPFWPGVVIATATPAPATVADAVGSAGTVYRVTVAAPLYVLAGSRTI